MTEEKHAEKKFDVVLNTRNFEIDLFWKRSLFFWGFIASAFVAYAALAKDADDPCNYDVHAHLLVTCFGLFCSYAWVLINHGGKYWQTNWERILEKECGEIGKLFMERKPDKFCFSPSKVTMCLSYFTMVIWFLLLAKFAFITDDAKCDSVFSENMSDSIKAAIVSITIIAAIVTGYITFKPYKPGQREESK